MRRPCTIFALCLLAGYASISCVLNAQIDPELKSYEWPELGGGGGGDVRKAETIAAMQALADLTDGDQITTAGAYINNDGRGRLYRYYSTPQTDEFFPSSINTLANTVAPVNQRDAWTIGNKVVLRWTAQPTSDPQVRTDRLYYVNGVPTAGQYTLSETSPGGATINFSTAGTGVEIGSADDGLDVLTTPDDQAGFLSTQAGSLVAKGDIHVSDGVKRRRVPVGPNGTVLSADSNAFGGVAWKEQGARWFDNVAAAIAATDYIDGQSVATRGYFAPNDDGAARYVYTAAETLTPDGGFVHAVTSGGRLVAVDRSVARARQWGCVGDGAANDAARITAMRASESPVHFSKGSYLNGSHTIIGGDAETASLSIADEQAPNVAGVYRLTISGSVALTNLLGGETGQVVIVNDAVGVGVTHTAGQLELAGGENFLEAAGSSLALERTADRWREVGRAVPADGGKRVVKFDSVADAVAAKFLQQRDAVYTTGYTAPSDGGGNHFVYSTSQSQPENGGTVINVTAGGQLIAADTDTFNLRQWGARGDGVTDDSPRVQAALDAAQAAGGGTLVFTNGTYLMGKALQMNGTQFVHLRGLGGAVLKRTNQTTELINGTNVATIIYAYGTVRYCSIKDLSFEGVRNAKAIEGINLADVSRCVFSGLRMDALKHALKSRGVVYMSEFSSLNLAGCDTTAVDFSDTSEKTSLNFENCYVYNSADAYDFRNTKYTTFTDCGADYCNLASGGPWGQSAVYGDEASPKGVYNFIDSNVTLTAVGAEQSFGNGVVYANGGNSSVTVNSMMSVNVRSSYEPNYTTYPNWAVGPIATGTEGSAIHVASYRPQDFQNTFANGQGKPEADLVAYNYDEANGVREACRVFVATTPTTPSNGLILGAFADAVKRNCKTAFKLYKDPQFQGTIKLDTSTVNSVVASGTGTVITIPITSQGTNWRNHAIRIIGTTGESSSSPVKMFACDVGLSSLTSLTPTGSLQTVLHNGVASVATSGMNLQITLNLAVTNPIIKAEVISLQPDLIQWANATVASP